MDYINVSIVEWLPISIKGLSTRNADDGFTIILNGKYSIESQWETYIHELSHICNDDFSSVITASELELLRHGGQDGH